MIMFQNLKISLKIVVSFLAFAFMTQVANAGFMVTPNVGYKSQSIKITSNSDISADIKMNSPVLGLKLGYQSITGVGIDLAGSYSSGKAQISTSGVETEEDYKHTVGAVQVSVAASLFKIYLGYILLNDLSFDNSNPGGSSQLKGPGYQVGLAFNLTQSVSLGAQYQIDQFNEIKIESVGKFESINTYYKKFDSQSTSIHLTVTF